MPVSVELLRRFNLLQELPLEMLEELAAKASLKPVARRGIVLHGGERSDNLCFLFEGRLQGVDFTLDGREVGLYFVEPGDFCGELGLFEEQGQPENVIALARSQVVFMPSSAVRLLLQHNYQLVEQLFRRMALRVRKLTAQRALLGQPSTTARVCGQLWMIFQDQQNPSYNEILNPPTHQELGIMLNLSRETVTRVFQKLQNQKVVKRDGTSKLLILDPVLLKEKAESTGD